MQLLLPKNGIDHFLRSKQLMVSQSIHEDSGYPANFKIQKYKLNMISSNEKQSANVSPGELNLGSLQEVYYISSEARKRT